MNEYNKISVFAKDAVEWTEGGDVAENAYFYSDTSWAGQNNRKSGVKKGVASSVEYNTALRQASLMSSVFADILAHRNDRVSPKYAYMEDLGIGTRFDNSEVSLEGHVASLSKIMQNGNFLFDSEVTTSKIANLNVTTGKIADNAITSQKLGSILGSESISSTANNMKVTISQDSSKGKLKLEVTGSSATKAESILVSSGITANSYIWSRNVSAGNYTSPQINTDVYITSGGIITSKNGFQIVGGKATISSTGAITSTATVTADSFNATSDIRKKESLKEVDFNNIKEIVENIDLKTFIYKGKEDRNIGIIAQDLQKLEKDFKLIDTDEKGYLTIKESRLIYVLWRYIQELRKEIDEVKNGNNQL